MKNYTVSQGSLFSQKGDFDPTNFEKQCLSETFISCVKRGVTEAIHELDQMMVSVPLCTRNKSSILNELIAKYVKANIEKYMIEKSIFCYVNTSGNKRNVIEYGDYTFIFRKNIDSRNDTEIARKIDEQKLNNHIITINYSHDVFWTKIISLSFLYIQNGNVSYMYSVNTDNYNRLSFENALQTSNATQIAKPTLKTKSKIQQTTKLG